MPAIERALVVILICILFIVPVGLVGSPSPDRDQEIDGEIDNIDEPENENSQTRASTGSRANFEIFVNSPLTMPEVYSSWNQSDWSGGAGQNVWSETDKFNISSGINSSTPDEQLELGPGDFVEAWKRVKDGPEGRYRHTMTWAESRGVFYMFGGHGPGWTTTYNDLWEYNPATDTWTEKGQSGGPSTRQGQTMVWDSVHDLLWIFGGNDGDEDDRFNDLWSYNPVSNSWSQKAFAFDDKCYAAGAFDPNSQQIIIYGGYAGSWNNPSHEVWAFNTTTNLWSMKHNYTRRVYHDATWCEKTKSMFFYGGASQRTGGGGGTYTYVDQLNEYFPQMDTWVNHSGTGDRVRPILAYDSKDEKLLMHGGGRGNDDYRDINYYDIDLGNWFARMESDMNDRDYADGDWDTINNPYND